MAKEEFNFEELQTLNLAQYVKTHCRPIQVQKAKAGIVLTDFLLKGKKVPCLFLPFKKVPEAMALFKQIKASKIHKMVKVALVQVQVSKTEIQLTVKKGGLSNEGLASKATVFFQSKFKLTLKTTTDVAENAETTEDTATTQNTVKSAPEKEKKKTRISPERKAKATARIVKVNAQLNKIMEAFGIS